MKSLRDKAERLLEKMDENKGLDFLKNVEDANLIHEILVYHKELEIQKEELERSYEQLEDMKNRYLELYNNAPSGYVTLNQNGVIMECNKTFLDLVGKDTIRDGYTSFAQFIHKDDLERFLSIYRRY